MHFKNWSIQIQRLILLFCIGFSTSIFCQNEARWVQCSGEAAVQNITYEEAQVIAKRRARFDAIEKVCGINLQAETLVKDFVLAGDFIHSISYGHVVEEKDVAWKTETLPPEKPGSPPVILLRIEMQAKVVPITEKPDPDFKVDLKLNRTVFQSNDEMILRVKTTKDSYLTVLNLAANDSVYVLFPNKFQDDNFIEANNTIEIPSKIDRDSGLHIRVVNLLGHKRDTEIVKVIATKQKITFLDEVDTSSGFGLMGTPKVAVMRLAGWLSEILISERAEATVMYEIHSGE